MFRSLLVLIVVVCAAAAASPPALAQVTVALTGETLNALGGPGNVQCGATPADVSTVTYDASGVAAGPDPGTFVESGSVTFSDGVVETRQAR